MSGAVRTAKGPKAAIGVGKSQLRRVIDPAVAAVFEVDVHDLRAATRRCPYISASTPAT